MAKLNLGRVAFVLRGEWAQGAYNKLDVVSYGTTGDSYVSRVDNNTALPTDDTKWLRLTNVGDSVTAANQAAQAANTAAANATAAAASGVRTDTAQGLTDVQKATARSNIDAAYDVYFRLQEENIPGTVQSITFDESGNVTQIIHSENGVAVRTDAFTFATGAITEVRTLASGESLTIVTDTFTLETTTTYSAA